MPNKIRPLVDRIESILWEGFRLLPETLHFIESTFDCTSIKTLAVKLDDNSDSDHHTITELIYFPDEAMQLRIEDVLEQGNYVISDEFSIVDLLVRNRPATRIFWPAAPEPLNQLLPVAAAKPFLSRLHITRRIDPKLLGTIQTRVSRDNRLAVKVKLRNCNVPQTPARISFLNAVLTKIETASKPPFECLTFVLNLLPEIETGSDIYHILSGKKMGAIRNLQLARNYQSRLKKGNIEILLAQGIRSPFVNQSQLMKEIILIDEICLALLRNSC